MERGDRHGGGGDVWLFGCCCRSREYVMWNGATDMEEEGTFLWQDGTPLNWSNWDPSKHSRCRCICLFLKVVVPMGCFPLDMRVAFPEESQLPQSHYPAVLNHWPRCVLVFVCGTIPQAVRHIILFYERWIWDS